MGTNHVKWKTLQHFVPYCGRSFSFSYLWKRKDLILFFIVAYEIFFLIIFLGRVFHKGNVLI